MADRAVYPANDDLRSEITLRVVTDGEHHVLDRLPDVFKACFDHVITQPADGKMLGFEAQKHLSQGLEGDFDWFGYLEDDLLIHDLVFLRSCAGLSVFWGLIRSCCPSRFADYPNKVDRFYIDGPIDPVERQRLVAQVEYVWLMALAGVLLWSQRLIPMLAAFS